MNSNKRLAVLHSSPIWLPQTQTWMYSQVLELQRLGVDVHVACERIDNLDQFKVGNIHSLTDEPIWRQVWGRGLRILRLRRYLGNLVRVGQEIGANIVHSHFGNAGWANLGALRHIGAKHVVTFYGLDVNKLPMQRPIWLSRYAELFERADLFLCEGSHMAQSLVKLGCPASKVVVQHLGVDVERIGFQPRHWQFGEPLKVLIAASFREKKGIPYAIEALGILRKHLAIEVTIIGDAGAEPGGQAEKARILAALKQTGLGTHTRLLGYQSYAAMLREAYAHHVFLHPSVTATDGDTEGGAPVCITEMLATGMPVVSTWHCDIPEVVGTTHHAYLAKERDIEGLTAALTSLIEQPQTWEALARAGRQRIETEYHRVRQAERLAAHYQRVLES